MRGKQTKGGKKGVEEPAHNLCTLKIVLLTIHSFEYSELSDKASVHIVINWITDRM